MGRMRSLLALPLWLLAAGVLAQESALVRLPSEATGGGTLAVQVSWPTDPAADRYRDGLPVFVPMRGGLSAGDFQPWTLALQQGFVVVQFLYPGGEDAGTGAASDGVYDVRGPGSVLAARDAWLFAAGRTTDEIGRSVGEIVGRTVRTDVMGVSGHSNGGNIGPVVLSVHSGELAGLVRWFHGWESGASAQVAANEVAWGAYDCDPLLDGDGNGEAIDDDANPRFDPLTQHGYEELALDYSQVAWDPTLPLPYHDESGRFADVVRFGLPFFDGNADGRYDHRAGEAQCPDTDLDGVIELDEDYPLSGRVLFLGADQPRLHLSPPLTRHLEANPGLLPGGAWPDWLADSAQSEEFWSWRVAAAHAHRLQDHAPGLRVIHSFAAVGHARTVPGHADSLIHHEGYQLQSGLWFRIQPDASYVREVLRLPVPAYRESDANEPFGPGDLEERAAPSSFYNQRDALAVPAGAELADRTYFGCWQPNLDDTLPRELAAAGTVGTLRVTTAGLSWEVAPGELCHDAVRGRLSELRAARGDWSSLASLSCLAEDAPDAASDTEPPPPADAWFYLVRPNSVNGGGWGESSAGTPRAVPEHVPCVR